MTANQLAYQANVREANYKYGMLDETVRNNKAQLGETSRHNVMSEILTGKGLEVTQRGQDLNYNATVRGQDIMSATTRRGQDLNYNATTRGQDMQLYSGMRGQDLTYAASTYLTDTNAATQRRGQNFALGGNIISAVGGLGGSLIKAYA